MQAEEVNKRHLILVEWAAHTEACIEKGSAMLVAATVRHPAPKMSVTVRELLHTARTRRKKM